MEEPTQSTENAPPEAPPAPPEAPDPQAGIIRLRDLRRDVTGLIARMDQAESAIAGLNVEQMILFFAVGALAGVVFLQHRELRALAG
jgi:hypothetical protein